MIKRIRPVTRVARIEGEIQRLMNDVLSERRELPELQGGWIPLVDVYEREDDIIIEAEVPGLLAREIIILLRMSRIEIKGVKKEAPVPGCARYLRLEREYGKFRRALPLPCSIAPDEAKAYLENGILTVHLKKLRESRAKDIVVKIQKGRD
jgi:HSP20 family protein